MVKIKNWSKTKDTKREIVYENDKSAIMLYIVKNPNEYAIFLTDVFNVDLDAELLATYKTKKDALDFSFKFMRGNRL